MVSRLELTKATNGGWIVTEPGESRGYLPQAIAAYSDDASMLDGLAGMLGIRITIRINPSQELSTRDTQLDVPSCFTGHDA